MPAAKKKIRIAKKNVVALFEGHPTRIFARAALARLLSQNRDSWRSKKDESTGSFIKWCLKNTSLRRHDFPLPYRKEVRYTWGDVPLYELINSLKPGSYFTHYTALSLHELTDQVPKVIYLNHEQAKESVSMGGLTQDGIHKAFKRAQRESRNRTDCEGFTICVVNGRNTGRLGVVTATGPGNAKIEVTDLERTLIDAAVRPAYCGGVAEVLGAYRAARSRRVSINRLCAYLNRLAYIYPYHQAIGFYLERAGGYTKSQLELLHQFPIQFEFYLTHGMRQTAYDEKWKLFFPKGF